MIDAMLIDITPRIEPGISKVWPGDTPPTREVLCRMSEGAAVDLSTLRWSWDDYILIHEILTPPDDESHTDPQSGKRYGLLAFAIVHSLLRSLSLSLWTSDPPSRR